MSKVQILRSLVSQRLNAAAEEVFELFARTIAEYEDQLRASKEENHRQQKLLDSVLNPDIQLHRAVFPELSVSEEKDPPEKQQERRYDLKREIPESPQIKEEPEEQWSSQDGEQLQGPEETEMIRFTHFPVTVKSEDGEEEPQSSQLHQAQTEQMETGDDGEACGEPAAAMYSNPERDLHLETEVKTEDSSEPETDDSADWEKTKHQKVSNLKKPKESIEKLYSCTECGKRFTRTGHLRDHMRSHTGEKPFSCSECGRNFALNQSLIKHTLVHTKQKPFGCSECEKSFSRKSQLTDHMSFHTGEKPFSCSECGKGFNKDRYLNDHMLVHSGQKPFGCSQCEKRFYRKSHLTEHMNVHMEEKPFRCSECGKSFPQNKILIRHMLVHKRQKLFSCSQCEKRFYTKSHLSDHKNTHAGEKPFSCSECGQRFTQKKSLTKHMHSHRESLRRKEADREVEGEDCGGSEQAGNSDPSRHLQPETGVKTEDSSELEIKDCYM